MNLKPCAAALLQALPSCVAQQHAAMWVLFPAQEVVKMSPDYRSYRQEGEKIVAYVPWNTFLVHPDAVPHLNRLINTGKP